MNVLSLFDGMSCGQLALTQVGLHITNYFACEIKPHAIKVTQENFPETIQLGDVTKVTAEDLPKIDIIIGGSPCQDFSQANRIKMGLEGAKSGLFFEYVRLLKEAKPKYFFLENVRMKKEASDIISEELGVQPITLNSKDVCGQLRTRSYWTNIPFDGLTAIEATLQDQLSHGYTDRLKARCLLESDSRPPATPVKMFHRYYNTGFTTLIFKSQAHYTLCKSHFDKYFKGMSAKEIDVAMVSAPEMETYEGLRYLNQEELERLQTVPNGYTKNITRNQSASLLGDGWTVEVIAQFFKGIQL